MAFESGLDNATEQVLAHLSNGYNIEQVAGRMEISPEEVHDIWTAYKTDRRKMSKEDQWLLYLLRLEKLYTQASELLEGQITAKNLEAAVAILQRLEELHNLNLSRVAEAKEDSVTLTEAQVGILFQVFEELKSGWKAEMEKAFENKTIKAIKGELLDNYDNTFGNLHREALVSANGDQE